jgi:lysine-N-methylase
VQLVTLEDDGADEALPDDEADLLALREKLMALLQDDTHPLEARLDALLAAVDFAIPEKEWAEIYRGLERLDPAWDSYLDALDFSLAAPAYLHAALRNFAVYMLYRHLPGALEDDDIPGRVAFCVLSTRILAALCAGKDGCTIADCIEFARMYSAEIEYSEDNICALLDALWEED